MEKRTLKNIKNNDISYNEYLHSKMTKHDAKALWKIYSIKWDDTEVAQCFVQCVDDNVRIVSPKHVAIDLKNVQRFTNIELGAIDYAFASSWVQNLSSLNSKVGLSNAKALASAYHKITGKNLKQTAKLMVKGDIL